MLICRNAAGVHQIHVSESTAWSVRERLETPRLNSNENLCRTSYKCL